MNVNRSFFVPINSVIHRLNPFTKLVFAFAIILPAFLSSSRIIPFLIIPILIVVILGKIHKQFLNLFFKLVLPTILFMFVMQSVFLPDGDTVLFHIWIFDVTKEAVQKASLTVSRIFLMVSSFAILLLTTHPSELMSDLTRRGLPAQFAYVIISTLQILPQMQAKAQTIIAAQRSRGLDTESTFFKRAGSVVPLVGPLVFGSLVEVEEKAIAIEARGFTSKRTKTFLHEIPDSNVNKILRWVFIAFIIISIVLNLWLS